MATKSSESAPQPPSQESSDAELRSFANHILQCGECGREKPTDKIVCVACAAWHRLQEVLDQHPSPQVLHLAADLIDRDTHILEAWAEALTPTREVRGGVKRARVGPS